MSASAADTALFDRMARELSVAVISDVLDSLGHRDQVMHSSLRPVNANPPPVLVGRAHTVLIAPHYEVVAEPYTTLIAAIDATQQGDVVVLATGGYAGAACWGELFSNAVVGRGGRGAIMDGYHRDTRMIQQLDFPVFSTGALPQDISGRARAVEFGRPVRCAGANVRPGDIIFAEVDGIAVIPAEITDVTVQRAFEKVATEDRARDDLRQGALLSDVWARYRVL